MRHVKKKLEREMEGSMNLLSNRTVANSMHVEEKCLRMISIIPPDDPKSNKESMDDDDEVRNRISWRLVKRRSQLAIFLF
jgi:hypothetical protein